MKGSLKIVIFAMLYCVDEAQTDCGKISQTYFAWPAFSTRPDKLEQGI